MTAIRYRVDVDDAHAHRFAVTLSLAVPAAEQIVSLPVWIPGSYLVREFARHLSGLQARQGRHARALEQLDKCSWRVHCHGSAALTLSWHVHAFDTSVRAAYLDAERGFFNGTSLLLRVHGREHEPHQLQIGRLPRRWQVASAMRPLAVDAAGRGTYVAADYDELVDHPFELGRFWRGRFKAAGVAHEFVVAGAWPGFDGDRLLADSQRICAQQIAFWHGRGARARPPFDRYVFMLNALEDGHGGLEHRASTALVAPRRNLPRRGADAAGDGQVSLLGLISHEYFHAWNVKRLAPRELVPLDYARENHTRLLWFFEGFTSYYDDLMLLRAGLIDAPRYLKLLAKQLSAVLSTPGRHVQSVAESSFDAWVKYYRSDENTPNATVSYYAKGAAIALALDLSLRRHGRTSLDAAMRALWRRCRAGALEQSDIDAVVAELGGARLAAELKRWVHGTADLPLPALLQATGVHWASERGGFAAALGLRVAESAGGAITVRHVLSRSAAERAGLCAGDELIAINGWRLRKLDDALAWLHGQREFDLLLARDQRVLSLRINTAAGAKTSETITLTLADKPGSAQAVRRRAWLGC